ncbi:hypothetical protein [uncultured Brevundimonas sp.]|uniref:hypothetical protein n=1 Tax=uncultured Brevundimonas sp. TaxID=213418 RepID=UPI0025DAFBD0|nr:hypothetical protein [uncultured Brevundimonas sp.]
MTAFDYARAAQTAERLIRNFGAAGAIRRQTPGAGPSYDPGEPTLTDHPVHVAITRYTNREVDGQRIQASDRKALVEPTIGVEPKTSDLLVTPDGSTLTIVDVTLLRPATTTILYVVQVR